MARRTLNDDLFFFHRDRKAIEWVYHNPDSNSEGQFVITYFPYDELLHTFSVDLVIKESQQFFIHALSLVNTTYLADKGTPEYETEMNRFFHSKPDAVGTTRKTISKLILEVAKAKAEEFKLQELQNEIKDAEAEIKKPFEKEEEYQQKSARLEELTNLLSINKDEHDDIDVEGIEVNPNERNII